MKRFYPGLFAGLFIVASTMHCTGNKQQDAKTAQTAVDDTLSVAQLLCVETSNATSIDVLKTVCAGIDQLTPSEINFVLQLLEQKKAAEKIGYYWKKPDAGAPVLLSADGGK